MTPTSVMLLYSGQSVLLQLHNAGSRKHISVFGTPPEAATRNIESLPTHISLLTS